MTTPSDPTVLIVDDDDRVRATLAQILRSNGFQVAQALSGRDALTRVCGPETVDPKPDLIVLDAHLPEVSGFDMCRILKSRQDTAAIPILMLSGVYREAVDKARGLEFGSDAY